jgi:hypothetical protein
VIARPLGRWRISDVKAVYIPDVHVPYLHEESWESVLAFIKSHRPESVTILGDFLDCYAVSRYDQMPGHPGFNEEITEGLDRLADLRKVHKGALSYLEGNHEQRLTKYIARNAGALNGAMPLIPELLRLADKKILWVPWGTAFSPDGIWLEHGDCSSSKAGYTAHSMIAKRGVFRGVSAHTHRLALVHRTTPMGTQQWAEAGSLCRPEAMEYTIFPDWQLGFTYLSSNGNLTTVLLETVGDQERAS